MTSKEISILEHAATNGFNALLVGGHGVGKTAMVKEVFDKLNMNWKYFSASTIDPWVDLVGVPKEKDGVLELVRPANLDFDNIEGIFLDEYNRAPKKVRNAVMELIQFKSINGKKFPKLKVVFAAINPDDDEEANYDVEKLDPAQLDRFHVHLPVPNEPCTDFFRNTYGSHGTLAVKWWISQTDKVKGLISPRRLESGVRVFLAGGDVQYVFDPNQVNIGEFAEYLDKPDPIAVLEELSTKDEPTIRAFFKDNNKFKHVRQDLMGKERFLKKFATYLPEEELMQSLRSRRGNRLIGYVVSNVDKFEHLIPDVLSNPRAYSNRVVEAFGAHQKTTAGKKRANVSGRKITVKGEEVAPETMTVCFSGKLSTMNRAEAEQLLHHHGISIATRFNFKVTHLVVSEKPGDKVERAKRQGVTLLTEKEFYDMVDQLYTENKSDPGIDDLKKTIEITQESSQDFSKWIQ